MDAAEVTPMQTSAALAADLEAVVRTVAGVRNVYRSGSLVSNVIGSGAAALGIRPSDEPLVSVQHGDGGVSVEASVGIESTADAADTLRATHEAIDALCAGRRVPRARITLTVVYIQSREAS